jgi:uncharacterized membrane protein YjgN (DUF898 family)
MIFKIYLGVSILTLAILVLHNLSGINQAKHKYKEELKMIAFKSDTSGVILSWLKIFIYSFIPVMNVAMLFIFVFFGNKIQAQVQGKLDKAIEQRKNA